MFKWQYDLKQIEIRLKGVQTTPEEIQPILSRMKEMARSRE